MSAPLSRGLFVTGSDTGVGKTVASALLVRALDADYWKAIQSGVAAGTSGGPPGGPFVGDDDSAEVARLAKLPLERIHAPAYRLKAPRSPHEAAALEGARVALSSIALPRSARPVVVEGAGGVLVPLNERELMVDLMVKLALPVVLVVRTALGTLNHTLLSLEALRARKLPVLGLIAIGAEDEGNLRALTHFGGIDLLAHLPTLSPLDEHSLWPHAARLRVTLAQRGLLPSLQ